MSLIDQFGNPLDPVERANPSPRALTAKERLDGWGNVLTGLGVTNRDKSVGNTLTVEVLSKAQQENAWRGDDLAAKIIELPPDEMTREGFEIKIQEEEDKSGDEPSGLLAGEGEEEDLDNPDNADPDLESVAALEDQEPSKPEGNGDDEPSEESEEVSSSEDEEEKPRKSTRKDAFPPKPGNEPPQASPFAALAPPKPPPGLIEKADDTAKKQAEDAIKRLEELNALEAFNKALKFERCYGGGAIYIWAEDGLDPVKPLDVDNIKTLSYLTVLSAWELQPVYYYNDPRKPKYGEPEIYRIVPRTYQGKPDAEMVDLFSKALIHESRLLVFKGIETSRDQMLGGNAGWGDSVLVRCIRVIEQFQIAFNSAAALLPDFAQAVYKIQDLAQLIATDRDSVVIDRLRLLDLQRSVIRGVILDSEEDFERKTTSLAGLPELLERFENRLAGTAQIPITKLFGQSPGGMNATGEYDQTSWYDQIKGLQTTKLLKPVKRLVKLLFLAKDGPTKGKEPENWSIEFKPLKQLSEKEQSETRLNQAQIDKIYIDSGVLTPEEVARSRFGGDGYSFETTLDLKQREKSALDHEAAIKDFEKNKGKALKSIEKGKPALGSPEDKGNGFAGIDAKQGNDVKEA
jgi:phage-related protein (TIGR01555 family)